MAVNHSDIQPHEATQRFTVSADGAFYAEQITPPRWAYTVDILNPEGAVRIASTGTDGALLDANYVSVPSGAGYGDFALKGREEATIIRPFYIAAAGVEDTVEVAYRPRQ